MSRKELYKRKRYAVFACYHCRAWQYSNMFQKTHNCIKCGKTLLLKKVNPHFETDYIDKAIKIVQELKKRAGLRKSLGEFVTADKLRL